LHLSAISYGDLRMFALYVIKPVTEFGFPLQPVQLVVQCKGMENSINIRDKNIPFRSKSVWDKLVFGKL
jgi:hypothetical protein